ncbi:MAG: tetraacyldisaccharide 4'-kinase [Terracidiphilus sp.]
MTRPLLWPLVPLYRLGLALRERKFRPGSPVVRRLRWPVISIGNLSTGGSGKTPLTIALAKALTARGLHIDVLSRGYGRRRSAAAPLLVKRDGTASEFGDEPLEIARAADVPVYVAPERYQAGLLAERAASSGVHLLDDGFQHRQLYRDIDILLLSRADFVDHLLPAGNLREALRAAERANVIAIGEDEPELEAEIRSRGWRAQIWRLRRQMDVPHFDGPVAAFCGIARPEQFFAGLERAGAQLAARWGFADHHRYTAADLARIATSAERAGAQTLLTTEKDCVRLDALADSLPSTLRLQAVPLRIGIENQHAAIDWLLDQVRGPR